MHPSSSHPVPPAPVADPAVLRSVLGHFASGVVVVTATGPDGPLGLTCQTFASLSLGCAWVDCALWREYDGGDHTTAVGRVADLAADPSRPPLLHHRGRYGVTGQRIAS